VDRNKNLRLDNPNLITGSAGILVRATTSYSAFQAISPVTFIRGRKIKVPSYLDLVHGKGLDMSVLHSFHKGPEPHLTFCSVHAVDSLPCGKNAEASKQSSASGSREYALLVDFGTSYREVIMALDKNWWRMVQPEYRAACLGDTPYSEEDFFPPAPTKRIARHKRHCTTSHFDVMSPIHIPGRTEYRTLVLSFEQLYVSL
jgi:hypothetical protein